MKDKNKGAVSVLEDLPNVGKAIADRLRQIDIDHPRKLSGKDPFNMYDELCKATGQRHDPCVIDVFMSAVYFMETGKVLPWHKFTEERKNILKKRETE
ncbi:MAG: mitomycin resistance protein [Candidatus Cloacimonadota bacterium]|nr:MAG: mitomycin resistance protein [Candidatus Cloacimonadota bacterium]